MTYRDRLVAVVVASSLIWAGLFALSLAIAVWPLALVCSAFALVAGYQFARLRGLTVKPNR